MDKLPDVLFIFAYCVRSPVLHMAAYLGGLTKVDYLLERGANANSTANPKGMTPLHLASIGERSRDACLLAPCSHADHVRLRALHSGGHDDVVARLLDAGAVPSIKDKKGRTALAYATRLGREAVRRRLLVAGRDGAPDRPQSSGQPDAARVYSTSCERASWRSCAQTTYM